MMKEILFDDENKLIPDIKGFLEKNIEVLRQIFDGCQDVVQKTFVLSRAENPVKIHIVYMDGLTDNSMVEETILKPLTYEWRGTKEKDIWDAILYCEAQTVDIKTERSFDLAVAAVLKGDTAIFVDGYNEALIVSTKKYPLRSISENETEAGLRGPRDTFNEGLRQSTALIRRRIRDPKLKCEQGSIGQRSRTDYALMYLSDVADPFLVKDLKSRLQQYEIDAIFDSGMMEHLLEDNWKSPFPSFQATTRPDKVAAGITEGRVAIVVDNSPEVIVAPSNFNMLLQASDDYYNRWAVGTFARFLRYVAAFIAISFLNFTLSAR